MINYVARPKECSKKCSRSTKRRIATGKIAMPRKLEIGSGPRKRLSENSTKKERNCVRKRTK